MNVSPFGDVALNLQSGSYILSVGLQIFLIVLMNFVDFGSGLCSFCGIESTDGFAFEPSGETDKL